MRDVEMVRHRVRVASSLQFERDAANGSRRRGDLVCLGSLQRDLRKPRSDARRVNVARVRSVRVCVRDVSSLGGASSAPSVEGEEADGAERDHGGSDEFVGDDGETFEVETTLGGEEDGAHDGEAGAVADAPAHAEDERARGVAKGRLGAGRGGSGVHVRGARGGHDGQRAEMVGAHQHVKRTCGR